MLTNFVEGRYALKRGDEYLKAMPLGTREFAPNVDEAVLFSLAEHLALPIMRDERWVLIQKRET